MDNKKPIHHQVNVIEVSEIRAHPDPETTSLELIFIDGFQVVVKKGHFHLGDLAYYIPPDSVVPEKEEYAFLWGNRIIEGGVPEKRRRVTVRRFRGEYSEGLLMPVPGAAPHGFGLTDTKGEYHRLNIGDDVSDILGIYHYNPPEPGVTLQERQPKWPRSIRGWVGLIKGWLKGERRERGITLDLPTYDVQNFKKISKSFVTGEWVRVTEKIHGSNARFIFKKGLIGEGVMYAGSRNLWLSPKSQDVWHRALLDNPWIEAWCREYPNYCLYGEITPTQKGFNYGVPMDGGQPKYIRFFLFDIRKPNGKWAEVKEYYELSQLLDKESLQDKFIDSWVPLLYDGPYNYNVIKTFIDGETVIYGSKHLREGVVIKTVPERNIPGLGRAQLKIVSNKYLEEEK